MVLDVGHELNLRKNLGSVVFVHFIPPDKHPLDHKSPVLCMNLDLDTRFPFYMLALSHSFLYFDVLLHKQAKLQPSKDFFILPILSKHNYHRFL